MSWLGEPSSTMRPPSMITEPVAQPLGLVHVVRGEHLGDAALLESIQAIPHQMAGLGVEAGGGFVEQEEVGLVHQRTRDGEPALHAAGQRIDPAVGAVFELHELEQLGHPFVRTSDAAMPK